MRRSLSLILFCIASTLGICQSSNEIKVPVANVPLAATVSPTADAELLFRSGKFTEAITAYKAILDQGPKSAAAYAGLTRIYLKQENITLAHDVAHKGVEVLGSSSLTHTALGELYFREGQMAEAEREFLAAQKLDPSDARASFGLSRIYDSISMYRHGRDFLVRAHELDPGDPQIQRSWLRTLNLAERIASLQKYLASASNDDDEQKQAMLRNLLLLKERQRQPGRRCSLVTKLNQTETPLELLMYDPRRLRGWGLKVNINGHSSKLQLDTGASGIIINSRAAEKAGLTRLVDAKFSGIGDKGPVSGFTAYADSIKIGELEFQNCLVEVSDKRSVADEDGLIGADVFESYLVTLDFPGRKLRLNPLPQRPDEQAQGPSGLKTGGVESTETETSADEHAKPKSDAIVPAKIVSGPRDRYIAPEMQNYTRFFRFGHAVLIPTKIGQTSPKLFLVDTGASNTLISPAAAREVTKVNQDSNTTVKGLSGTVKNVYRADKAVLEFSHYRQENQEILAFDLSSISKHTGTEVSGVLGFSVLALMEVKIDYRDGLIDFVYHPR